MAKMTAVRVHFADGNSLVTEINGTVEDALRYYRIGAIFNLGVYDDYLVKVTSVDVLHTDYSSFH